MCIYIITHMCIYIYYIYNYIYIYIHVIYIYILSIIAHSYLGESIYHRLCYACFLRWFLWSRQHCVLCWPTTWTPGQGPSWGQILRSFGLVDVRHWRLVVSPYNIGDWLVVWNMTGLWLSIQLGMSASRLTNSYFSEGLKPPTRWKCWWYIYIYDLWQTPPYNLPHHK